jgi:putative flippase GtrA
MTRKRKFVDFHLLKPRFLRWVMVGIVTTGIDYIVFLILYKNLNSVFTANLLSSLVATSINYYSHHIWTFESSQRHSSTGPRYFLSLAFWWISSTFLIKWLIDSGINVEFAKLAPTFILLPINFLVLNKLVFKK